MNLRMKWQLSHKVKGFAVLYQISIALYVIIINRLFRLVTSIVRAGVLANIECASLLHLKHCFHILVLLLESCLFDKNIDSNDFLKCYII